MRMRGTMRLLMRKPGGPAQVAEPRRAGRRARVVVERLQVLDRGRGVPARLERRDDGDHAEAPLAQREQAHEAVLRREEVKVVLREVAVDVQIAQRERLFPGVLGPRKGGRAWCGRRCARPLGVDEPGRLRLLQPTAGVSQGDGDRARHRRPRVLREPDELDAALDRHTQPLQRLAQDALGLHLRDEEQVVMPAVEVAEVDVKQALAAAVDAAPGGWVAAAEHLLRTDRASPGAPASGPGRRWPGSARAAAARSAAAAAPCRSSARGFPDERAPGRPSSRSARRPRPAQGRSACRRRTQASCRAKRAGEPERTPCRPQVGAHSSAPASAGALRRTRAAAMLSSRSVAARSLP